MSFSPSLNRRRFLQASAAAAGLTLDTLPLKAQLEAGEPNMWTPTATSISFPA